MAALPEDIHTLVARVLDHPAIDHVQAHLVGTGDAGKACYLDLRLKPAWREQRRSEIGDAVAKKAIRRATLLFDLTYGRPKDADNPFAGWTSSFTQLPLSNEEMQEWVDGTLQRIAPFAHCPIVEVGCGTGLLAKPLSRVATSYVAIDPSPHAVNDLARWAGDHAADRAFSTIVGDARCLQQLQPDSAGLIIMNSVVQYFPSTDYLIETLQQCARILRPGGYLFIGDVRDLDLLDDFHLHRVSGAHDGGEMRAAQVRYLASRSRSQDGELSISPAFFRHLPDGLEDLQASMAGKRGLHRNEMNLYRYDVLLRYRPALPAAPIAKTFGWSPSLDIAHVIAEARSADGAVLLRGVPHDELTTGRTRLQDLRKCAADSAAWSHTECWSGTTPAPRIEALVDRAEREGLACHRIPGRSDEDVVLCDLLLIPSGHEGGITTAVEQPAAGADPTIKATRDTIDSEIEVATLREIENLVAQVHLSHDVYVSLDWA